MINIYDFDGVLACPIEDTVFRLDEAPIDDEFITMGRARYDITHLCNHTKRNRHLILQEVLYERGRCPRVGPMFSSMTKDPFYVLTARSGPGAVARVSQFFEFHKRRPEEMFFMGPISKGHMLQDLCDKFPDQTLRFYDDNQHHIDEANSLNMSNLEVHFIDNDVPKLYGKAQLFYLQQYDWLRSQPY